MVKEATNIDFITTGRHPSEEEFERISEWIKQKNENKTKAKKSVSKKDASSGKSICNSRMSELPAIPKPYF